MTFLHFVLSSLPWKAMFRFQLRYVLARISGINCYPKNPSKQIPHDFFLLWSNGPSCSQKNGWPTAKSDQVKFQVFRVANVSYCFAMDSQTHNPAFDGEHRALQNGGKSFSKSLKSGKMWGFSNPYRLSRFVRIILIALSQEYQNLDLKIYTPQKIYDKTLSPTKGTFF